MKNIQRMKTTLADGADLLKQYTIMIKYNEETKSFVYLQEGSKNVWRYKKCHGTK